MKIIGIDHIGVAVKDLETTLRFYQDVLGLTVKERLNRPEGQNRGAFVRAGQVDIELLENKDPKSVIARHIDKRGEGIQHIAFEVDNINKALTEAKNQGINFLDEKPRPGARGSRIVFIHPKQTYGILIELVER